MNLWLCLYKYLKKRTFQEIYHSSNIILISFHYRFEVNNRGHNYSDHYDDNSSADLHPVLNHNGHYANTHLGHDRYHFFYCPRAEDYLACDLLFNPF